MGKSLAVAGPVRAVVQDGRPAIARGQYSALLPNLRFALLDFQRQLRDARVPVVVIVAGADGVKSETVNCLHGWFDPRGIDTNVFGAADDVELRRPPYSRFATTLPARGRIGLYFGSWYTRAAAERQKRRIGRNQFTAELDRIAAFERTLVADGYLVIKIWLELSRREQRERLEKLQTDRRTSWRVSAADWRNLKHFPRTTKILREFRKRTDGATPWHVVSAADDRVRNVAVARAFLDAATERLATPPAKLVLLPLAAGDQARHRPLEAVDLRAQIETSDYETQIAKLQRRLGELSRIAHEKRRSVVLALEGWDAAGKGGTIRRIVEPLDARFFSVVPVAAPTQDDKDHHYLWRFWRHVPRDGEMTIYDRTWYGRVLVERVEGFAGEADWRRAYDEINEFESHLVRHGVILAKFWLHLSPEEQLRRFEEREVTPYKRHKITDEDWRNREKWDDYNVAVCEMFDRTSTELAPWTLVEANDKYFARIKVMRTMVEAVEAAL